MTNKKRNMENNMNRKADIKSNEFGLTYNWEVEGSNPFDGSISFIFEQFSC